MADRKSYRQFCALARALDHVGDRWTLLVVRELLLGPARYGRLLAALPGIATNLLADRLRRLEADGLVARDPGAHSFALTPHGHALEPVVLELIRWGAAYMSSGPGEDATDDRWAVLAVRALLEDGHPVDPPYGEVLVRSGDHAFTVAVEPDGRRVRDGLPAGRPRAAVEGTMPAILAAVAAGDPGRGVAVDGDAGFLRRALRPASPSAPPVGDPGRRGSPPPGTLGADDRRARRDHIAPNVDEARRG